MTGDGWTEGDEVDLPPGVLARLRIVWSPAELEAQRRHEEELATRERGKEEDDAD